jgi:hypothetical protein
MMCYKEATEMPPMPLVGRTVTSRRRTRLSFVLTPIFRNLLFALMKPLRYRRSPRYQHGLICQALRKVSVILLHDFESRLLGQLSMVLGK